MREKVYRVKAMVWSGTQDHIHAHVLERFWYYVTKNGKRTWAVSAGDTAIGTACSVSAAKAKAESHWHNRLAGALEEVT